MLAHWGFWEWVAYSAIAIAAVISALDLGLKHAPMVSRFIPSIIRGPVFGLLPFTAILLSAGIFTANQLGFIEPRKAHSETAQDITGSIPTSFAPGEMPSWLRVALAEYDVTRGVNGAHNPRIMQYLKSVPGNGSATDEDDWASAFAEWCLDQAGLSGPKSNRARAWVNWGREINHPELGAIAVFNFQGTEHVGFVLGETPDSLVVVGGNEVDRVQARRYYKKYLVAYRMPPIKNLATAKSPQAH